MKCKLLAIIVLVMVASRVNAQTTLDIIRASGYHRNTMAAYKNGYTKTPSRVFAGLNPKVEIIKKSSSRDIISEIVQRIQSRKKDISDYIRSIADKDERVFLYAYRKKRISQGNGDNSYGIRRSRYIRLQRGNVRMGQYFVYFSDGGSVYKTCGVKVNFDEETSVSDHNYSYTYNHTNNEVVNSGSICLNEDIQVLVDDYFKDDDYPYHLQMKEVELHLKNHIYCTNSFKTFTIPFTDNETRILEQQGNLEKLKQALKKASLL